FHNGSAATLQQVVEFYSRGGNFATANAATLDARIGQIGKLQNNPTNQMQVVDFLTSLTDDRVRFERAPFDHPELTVHNGSPAGALGILADINIAGQAQDADMVLPATGAGGRATALQSFLGAATAVSQVALTSGEATLLAGRSAFALSQPSP